MKQDKKKILGVCYFLSDRFDVDPLIVRIIFLLLFFAGFGSSLIIYLVIYFFLMPPEYKS